MEREWAEAQRLDLYWAEIENEDLVDDDGEMILISDQ